MERYKKPNIKIFNGRKHGQSFLLFGAIHGNEICGTFAINKLIREIKAGHIVLKKGTITLVPVCNPEAYKKKRRFIEENLNRVFRIWNRPNSYEKQMANSLAPLIQSCDIFLDIHSTDMQSDPMVFIDYPKKSNYSFSRILGVMYGIEGWPELYKREGQGIVSSDTIAYAEQFSKKCLTIECGQHRDPQSKKFAYQAIINTLSHFGFINGKVKSKSLVKVRMKHLFTRKSNKDSFSRNWKNFNKFKMGDILAKRSDGEKIVAPFNGVIIFPNRNAKIGTEWFYLGVLE